MFKIRFRKTVIKGAAILLCVLMTALWQVGCSSRPDTTKQDGAAPASTLSKTRIVTDMAGRQVEIPTKINTVYCAVPTAEAMVFSLAPEKMVAWVNRPSYEVKEFLSDRAKNLPVLGGWMGEKSTANLEEIAKVAPDLIIFMTTTGVNNNPEQIADSITQQTGRPVVIVDSSLASTAKAYRMLGDFLGVQDRAEMLASYWEKKMNAITETVSKVPKNKQVRVYYAEGVSGLSTDPSGSDHTQVLDFVKGINVSDVKAKGGQGMSAVSMEQVLSWNPDVVLVSSSTDGAKNYNIILNDPSWSKVKAVKEGKVYLTPLLPFGWFDRPPNVMRLIGSEWLACVLYPDTVKINLNQEIKDYFSLFFNQQLTDQQVNKLLKSAVPG